MFGDEDSSPLTTTADSDWYDPEESEHDLEHPKFWSEEDQEVVLLTDA
jgi:hypothetical protein